MPFSPAFLVGFGEAPTKNLQKNGTLILTSLLKDLVVVFRFGSSDKMRRAQRRCKLKNGALPFGTLVLTSLLEDLGKEWFLPCYHVTLFGER